MRTHTAIGIVALFAQAACGQPYLYDPVEIEIGGKNIKVGCDTMRSMDRNDLELVRMTCSHQEEMTIRLIADLKNRPNNIAGTRDLEREQKAWQKAKEKHCKQVKRDALPAEQELVYWNCREWASRCRLVDVVATYDRLTMEDQESSASESVAKEE